MADINSRAPLADATPQIAHAMLTSPLARAVLARPHAAALAALAAYLAARLAWLLARNARRRRMLAAQGVPVLPLTRLAHHFVGHTLDVFRGNQPTRFMALHGARLGGVYAMAGLLGRPTVWVSDARAVGRVMHGRAWTRTDESRNALAQITGWRGLLTLEVDSLLFFASANIVKCA